MKRFRPLLICHLILMALVLFFSLYNAGTVLGGFFGNPAEQELVSCLNGILYLATAVAVIFGFFHLLSGYGKKAASFYKTFLLLLVLACILNIILVLVGGASLAARNSPAIAVILLAVKALLLLALAYWKNLGKQKSWILFIALLVLDILYGWFFGDIAGYAVFKVISILTSLILDGTIGLSLAGKYADKDLRKTV